MRRTFPPARYRSVSGTFGHPEYRRDQLGTVWLLSLNRRMKHNLTVEQLDQLIDYEKSHTDRADVIDMFERRIRIARLRRLRSVRFARTY